jgi:predicted acyl esterase
MLLKRHSLFSLCLAAPLLLSVMGCSVSPAGPSDDGSWPPEVMPGMQVMVPMPDGTRLITDIYTPSGGGPWPVILLRTPYDSTEADRAAEHAGRAATLTDAGVAYVRQNSRGLYGSEGTADLFASDRQDGRDMITLLAAQSWCDGRIAMMGQSAPGIETYLALPDTTELACAWVEEATPNLYETVYQGGVFRKALVEDWLQGTTQGFLLPDVEANATNVTWWASRCPLGDFDLITTPTMHVTGWFDIFTKEQIGGFVTAQQAGTPSQYLIIGPWTHLDLDRQRQGELIFPANAADYVYPLYEEFLLARLLGEGDISSWPAVRYYVMGDVDDGMAPGNEWRTAPQWPPFTPDRQTFYLRAGGALNQTAPPAGEVSDQYDYDPLDPVPTVGGNNLNIPAGPYDQATVEDRADVLTYTTAVLTSPMEITGTVQAVIYLQCSQPDTDLIVRMCDVYPDGRSMAITEGVLRLRFRAQDGPEEGSPMVAGQTYEIALELWPTSIILNTGHRMRFAVTSSSDPRFDPNPNTGDAFRANSDTAVATVTVLHDQTSPSHIVLPTP